MRNRFFDGIDVSVGGIGLAGASGAGVSQEWTGEMARLAGPGVPSQYQPDRPQAIAPALADGLSATRRAHRPGAASATCRSRAKSDILFELGVKEEQFDHALVEALGLSLQATVNGGPPAGPRWDRSRPPRKTFTIAIPGQSFGVSGDLPEPEP